MSVLIKYGLPVLAAALMVLAVVHVTRSQPHEERVRPPIEPSHSPFQKTVAGAGLVEAQTENISIGVPVAGVVEEVRVTVGDRVEPGDLLFRIDGRHLRADLAVRQAAVAAAAAQLERLEQQPRSEEIPVAQAMVDRSAADVSRRQDQLRRTRTLRERGATTEEEIVQREQELMMSSAELARARAELELLEAGAWQADKQVARASLSQAEAEVERIHTELSRLAVTAPMASVVLQVNVRPGEFVGMPETEAAVVLGNIDRLRVRVDIDEQDIPRFVPGAPARAVQRGRPAEWFPMRFVRVEPFVVPKRSLTGMNTERVDTRVLQVIYELEPTEQQLYVGQQVDVFIDVGEKAAEQ